MKLMAIDSWNSVQISGIADFGSVCANFLSVKGEEPRIDFHHPFFKAEYSSLQHFAGVVGKFCPFMTFWKKSIAVRSLDYEALIAICREKFPGAKDTFEGGA